MIVVAVGVSGAGKTHGIRQSVYAHVRAGGAVTVVDRMREWSHVPSDLADAAAIVPDVATATQAHAAGRRLAIVQSSTDVVVTATHACELALQSRGAVAIPEAHRVIPSGGRVPAPIEDVLTAWRHYGVTLWADTQRIALLSRLATEQARELRIYATVGDRDHAVLRELGGRELSDAAHEAARRLASGEPGWHIRLGLIRVPPYQLHRDPP